MNQMLGDDFARRMRIPLADIVYLRNRPIRLMPLALRRRLARMMPERPARATPAEPEAVQPMELTRR